MKGYYVNRNVLVILLVASMTLAIQAMDVNKVDGRLDELKAAVISAYSGDPQLSDFGSRLDEMNHDELKRLADSVEVDVMEKAARIKQQPNKATLHDLRETIPLLWVLCNSVPTLFI